MTKNVSSCDPKLQSSTHVSFYTSLVDNLVDIICGDAGSDSCCSQIQHFSGQSADLSHTFLALLVQDLYFVSPTWRPLAMRNAI